MFGNDLRSALLLAGLALAPAVAQVAQTPISISVPDETAPPGGLIQMKVMLTEPKPISGTHARSLSMSPVLGVPKGIAAFSAKGDVSGAALIQNGQINVWLTSPSGSYGTDPDYPILAIAMPVSSSALPGQSSPIGLDPDTSVWRDLSGRPYAKEVKSGTFTVGSSPSVINVVPGGGPLPAGFTVRILGKDFFSKSSVQVNEVNVSSVRFINSTEIDITLRQAADLQGKRITIRNPDHTQVTYFSYLRGKLVGVSNRALLVDASPIFPSAYYSKATYATVNPGGSTHLFTALALQNANLQQAEVTISLFSAGNKLLGTASVNLAAGTRILRDLEELIPVQPGPGSYVTITAAAPVQMLALAADDSNDVLRPIPPSSAQ